MQKLSGILKHRDFPVLLFIFSLVLFVLPFMGSNLLSSLTGIFYYFYLVWVLVILVMILVALSRRERSDQDGKEESGN